MDKEPITLNGLNKLKEELIFLKEKKRPEIVAAIAEARSHGDLKENAEYHAAKEQQAQTESRAMQINSVIANANVIDVKEIENTASITSCLLFFIASPRTSSELTPFLVYPPVSNVLTPRSKALCITPGQSLYCPPRKAVPIVRAETFRSLLPSFT